MAKISLEQIQEVLSESGWKVITDSYKNLETDMTFECAEGHKVYSNWKKLRAKLECPVCQQNLTKFNLNTAAPPKKKGVQRVLALDQATHISGYSIFDGNELIKFGTFETSLKDEIERDQAVRMWLINLIYQWSPDCVAIEGIQLQDSSGGQKIKVTTYETLARLQGILMVTCFEANVPYLICPTNTWRHWVGVKGRVRTDRKRSAQLIIKRTYDLSVTEDEADAILIGKYAAAKKEQAKQLTSWE